jgi:hypothetical protein
MKESLLQVSILGLTNLLVKQLPSRDGLRDSVYTFAMVLFGALLLAPLVNILPMLGFDWYYFFNAGNPQHSLNSSLSTYPPFANVILPALTWMYWRHSLAILNSITLVSIAIGTWKQGGRYGSIVLAILNAPVLFLLWIGHPDSISLFGVITGFIPFILVKPPVAIWSIFSNHKLVFWTFVLLLLSIIIWPLWFLNLGKATPMSQPAFGWPVTGWPIAIVGVILLIGSGNNPFRLMAAGTMITPYLLPYHLAILAPGIGHAKGYRKIIIWLAAWLVAVGTGMGHPFSVLSFAFPLAVYFGNYSLIDVWSTLLARIKQVKRLSVVLTFNERIITGQRNPE